MEKTKRTTKPVKRQKMRQDEIEMKRKRVRNEDPKRTKKAENQNSTQSKTPKRPETGAIPKVIKSRTKSDQKSFKSDDASSRNSRSSTRRVNSRATTRTGSSARSTTQRPTIQNETVINISTQENEGCELKKLVKILVISSAVAFLLTLIFLIYIWLS